MKLEITQAVVFLSLLMIIVALCNWWLNRSIAKRVALAVGIAAEIQNQKLAEIYKVADGRLSDALQTIEDLKLLLVRPRTTAVEEDITEAIAKNN